MATPRTAARRTATTIAAVPDPEPANPRQIRSGAARARAASTVKHEEGKRSMNSSAYGQEQEQSEVVANREFAAGVEPAFIRVALGKTISLGAGTYEFLRIDVAVTLPCLPSELHETYEEAAEFAAEKLIDEEQQWLGSKPLPNKKASRR